MFPMPHSPMSASAGGSPCEPEKLSDPALRVNGGSLAGTVSYGPGERHDALDLIGLGIACASMGLKGFLLSSNFIDGGVTGVSMLVAALAVAWGATMLLGVPWDRAPLRLLHVSTLLGLAVVAFVGILLLGLAYAWRKGAMTWR